MFDQNDAPPLVVKYVGQIGILKLSPDPYPAPKAYWDP
jgi:hypothetical protein